MNRQIFFTGIFGDSSALIYFKAQLKRMQFSAREIALAWVVLNSAVDDELIGGGVCLAPVRNIVVLFPRPRHGWITPDMLIL